MNRSMLKALVGAAAGLAAVTAAPSPGAAQAAAAAPSPGAAQTGYAWANEPSSAEYVPSQLYSHNGGGGRVLISRLGTGSYSVQFEGLGGKGPGGGDVQVTSYGGDSNSCKVVSWSYPAPNFLVRVACFGSDGTPTDAMFTMLAGWPTGGGGSTTVVSTPAAARNLPPIPPAQRPGGGKEDNASAESVEVLSQQINALYNALEALRRRINELSR